MALRTCDIVMKGGITSGVVYPKAIYKLSEKFRFINIGGTSAGAIAAAVTAAAEYRRHTDKNDPTAGFEMIKNLGDDLIRKVGTSNKMRLLTLFSPNKGLKRVFGIMLSAIGHNSKLVAALYFVRTLMLSYWPMTLMGVIPGAALIYFSRASNGVFGIEDIWVLIGAFFVLVGAISAPLGWLVYVFLRRVPENHFGICNGYADKATPDSIEPLTIWLNDYINKVAGIETRERPLVFADLTNDEPDSPNITLQMMTTNLTHGRPYQIPFKDRPSQLRENHLFYFNVKEMRRLFPENVVMQMVANQRPITLTETTPKPEEFQERCRLNQQGYYAMPVTEQLPVIVATRMSLSFPILLSAIPLYSKFDHPGIKDPGDKLHGLKRCWFTDGGFCSNFPLHFFDGPIPKRPTFSLDLTQVSDDTQENDRLPTMDENNGFNVAEYWNRFEVNTAWEEAKETPKGRFGRLFGFGNSMLETMRNWNDATQSRLPGYRDRIVTIPLTSKEGGLNLNMKDETVNWLVDQGTRGSELLIERFYPDPSKSIKTSKNGVRMTWDNHRWVRLRTHMAAMEKMFDSMSEVLDCPESGDESYEVWLGKMLRDAKEYKHLGYKPSPVEIKAFIGTLELIKEYKKIWPRREEMDASTEAPRPRTQLRHRAQI